MTPSSPPLPQHDDWDMSPRREMDVALNMPTSFEPLSDVKPLAPGRNVLSNAEIEALLRPNLDDMPAIAEPEEVADKAIPDLQDAPLSPEDEDLQVQAVALAARLSLAFRQGCGLRAVANLAGFQRLTYREGFDTEAAGQGSAIACFAGPDGTISAMLVLSPPLAAAMVETACGGQPSASKGRELSLLDIALLEGLVRPLGDAISASLSFARIENDTEFAAALAGPGNAIGVDLAVRWEAQAFPARLLLADTGLPAVELRPPLAPGLPESDAGQAVRGGQATAVLTARVASLSVPLSRLADLKPGSTLLLGVPADQPVQLLSGGRDGPLVAEGDIGRKGERMALRITRRTPVLREPA